MNKVIKYQQGGKPKYKASVPPVEITSITTGRGKFLNEYERDNPYKPYTTDNQYLIKYKPDRIKLAEQSNRVEWERKRNNFADVKMDEEERIANIGKEPKVSGMNLTPQQQANVIRTQAQGRIDWKNKDSLQKTIKIAGETALALVPELITGKGLPTISSKLMKTRNPRLTIDELTALREELAVKGILPSQKTPNLPWKEPIRKGIEPWGYNMGEDSRQLTGTKLGDIKGAVFGGKNPSYKTQEQWELELQQIAEINKKFNLLKHSVNKKSFTVDNLTMERPQITQEPSLRKAINIKNENRFHESTKNDPSFRTQRNRYATWDMYLGKPQTKHPLYDVSELSTKDHTIYTMKEDFMHKPNIENRLSSHVDEIEYMMGKNLNTYTHDELPGSIRKMGDSYVVPAHDGSMFGTMGGFNWRMTKLSDGNYKAIANDVWDLQPFKNQTIGDNDKLTGRLLNKIINPVKNIEVGEALGIGKPLDVKVGFIFDPKTKKIVSTFQSGGKLINYKK